MPSDPKLTDKLNWSIVLLFALFNVWMSFEQLHVGHFSKFLYHPIVILVGRFALTYKNIRFLRLTNILSGNELIEFDRKFLWKNMTNIMGMKMIHNLRRND